VLVGHGLCLIVFYFRIKWNSPSSRPLIEGNDMSKSNLDICNIFCKVSTETIIQLQWLEGAPLGATPTADEPLVPVVPSTSVARKVLQSGIAPSSKIGAFISLSSSSHKFLAPASSAVI
jgi:hypothetical protein